METASYKRLISAAALRVKEASNGVITFEEHILLPHFGGNVMLRFALNKREVTLRELDALEKELYSLIPEGFLADFMGDAYRLAGVSYEGFEEKLLRCREYYRFEEIPVSPFACEVRAEGERLLKACALPAESRIWEIQPEDEPVLILLGERNEAVKEAELDGKKVHILTAEKTACEGLMRAAAAAKRKGISIMSAVEVAVR